MLAGQHGIRQKRDRGGLAKSFTAFVRRADEDIYPRGAGQPEFVVARSGLVLG